MATQLCSSHFHVFSPVVPSTHLRLPFLGIRIIKTEELALSLSQSDDECVDVAERVIELKWDYVDDSIAGRVRR